MAKKKIKSVQTSGKRKTDIGEGHFLEMHIKHTSTAREGLAGFRMQD